MAAPDYAQPLLGWRGWYVVEIGGALHLSSPVYETVWLPREETVARCRSRIEVWHWFAHPAPAEHCRCGIYAAHSPVQAAALVAERRFARANHALQAVLGRVSLWGTVLECERGWRAERAYPQALFLPALAPPTRSGRLAGLRRAGDAAMPPSELAQALSAYGVAVELIPCRSIRELADSLAADRGREP